MAVSIVEWPERLRHLVQDLEVTPGEDGKGYCRIDVDVDAESLFLLNDLEARARHRLVQIPAGPGDECVRGEMNTVIGRGEPSDPTRHVAKVRISFHDMSAGECAEDLP